MVDGQPQQRLSRVGAKAARDIVVAVARHSADELGNPPIAPLLHPRHLGDQLRVHEAARRADECGATEDRSDELGDVVGVELAVRVDGHQQIGTDLEGVANEALECNPDTGVAGVPYDCCPGRLCQRPGVVIRAVVVDDEVNGVDTADFLRHTRDDVGNGGGLVVGRNADQQMHRSPNMAMLEDGADTQSTEMPCSSYSSFMRLTRSISSMLRGHPQVEDLAEPCTG
jgi:hypothetical protein